MIKTIESAYNEVKSNPSNHKLKINLYSSIIQAKLLTPEFYNFNQHVSVDIKKFILSDIENSNSARIEYDQLHCQFVFDSLRILDFKYQIDILDFYYRSLILNGFDVYSRKIILERNRLKLINALSNLLRVSNIITVIRIGPIYNIFTILISIVICILISFLVSLPSQSTFLELLVVNDRSYVDSFYLNRLINTVDRFFSISSGVEITAKNVYGLFLLSAGKFLFYTVLALNLLKKLEDYLK